MQYIIAYKCQVESVASSLGGQISPLPGGSHPLLNDEFYRVTLDLQGFMELARSNLLQATHCTETISQAGVYGVGQLTDTMKKMVVVILFKDKSVQVAIASLGDASGVPIEQSVGEVSYKFVSRIDSMSLKCRGAAGIRQDLSVSTQVDSRVKHCAA